MDSDEQSQATLDLRKLSIQPYTPYRLYKNLSCFHFLKSTISFCGDVIKRHLLHRDWIDALPRMLTLGHAQEQIEHHLQGAIILSL